MGDMMWEFVTNYIRLLDENRREQFAAMETAADVDALRVRVRAKLAEMWGPFPQEKTPLNPRALGAIERGEYRIERIIYESRPRFFVTANLYRPTSGDGPFPGVIVPPGHGEQGKAYPAYQRFCAHLARSGFVALIWDPIGQGERLQLWDTERDAPLEGVGSEHSALGRPCYLLGINLMQYRVWDSMRAIDYLESRPDVDSERIAMAGNSGGGMETLQFACFDDRIKAAAPMCAVASFRAKTEALLIADPEQILYRTLRHGIEHAELLAAFAPKPLIIGSAIRDYVPIAAARDTFREVVHAYRLYGASDKVTLTETDDTHGLNKQLREATAGWLAHWLNAGRRGSDERVSTEEADDTLPEQDLRCTKTGQVATSLDPLSVLTLNQSYAREVAPNRDVPQTPGANTIFRTEIVRQVQFITNAGRSQREAGIYVPDSVFDPVSFPRGDAIVVSDTGRNDPLIRRSIIHPLIAVGYRVVALDLRGWGETKPDLPEHHVSFDWEDFFAYRSLEIGRPLLGQRMKDLLAAAPKLTTYRKWLVVGVGAGALVALHAAVIEPRIDKLVTVGGLLSYQSLVADPLSKESLGSYLPGVIRAYDVRELYAALAPRRVLAVNPMSSQRKPVTTVDAWEQLDWARQVYELNETPDAFQMETKVSSEKMREILKEWAGA